VAVGGRFCWKNLCVSNGCMEASLALFCNIYCGGRVLAYISAIFEN